MLLQFNFENYGPFKEEVSLNLEATSDAEYKEQIRTIGSKKVLPVAAIYGANASGKSFTYNAFNYRKLRVLLSRSLDLEKSKTTLNPYPETVPFRLNKESENSPSSFEVILTAKVNEKEVTLQYGFSVFQHQIVKEWLYQLPQRSTSAVKEYLLRDRENIIIKIPKLGDSLETALVKSTPSSALVLSFGARLNIEPFKTIYNFFDLSLVTDFGNFSEWLFRDHRLPNGIAENKEILSDCVSFLQSFEPSIKDIRLEEVKQDSNPKQYFVNTIHKTTDGKEVEFRRDNESAGTKKRFQFYSFLRQAIKTGSVLFVDELNSRLHPLLLRNILLVFLSTEKNPNNAQLIFTCHEPWLLSAKILRRDEIYFTNKDSETQASELYSLAEFKDNKGMKIRSDEDFEKNYLLGKYDGIPVLSNREVKGE